MSKIVEKKNESKSQLYHVSVLFFMVVSKIVEKKNESKSQLPNTYALKYNVVSKIVEKKNESKSQLTLGKFIFFLGCVKDR